MKIYRAMCCNFSTLNAPIFFKIFFALAWKIVVLSFLGVVNALSGESIQPLDLKNLPQRSLPALGVHSVTVAGLSSGAYMATQYQIAFASEIVGAGIVAGGPFYCAEGSLMRVAHHCMHPSAIAPVPDLTRQNENLNYFAHLGFIDNPVALKKHRVYVFGSRLDNTVYFDVVAALMNFYRHHIPKGQYLFDRHKSAAHALISPFALSKNDCAQTKAPFVNHCGQFDTAQNIFSHIYGKLKAAEKNPEHPGIGTLYAFDQKEFTAQKPQAISLAQTGYVYVPQSCEKGNCRLIMVLHGCRQNAENVRDAFIRQSGFLQWAAHNRTVVLFPQTTERTGYLASANNTILNPYACWDWWGYSTPNYIAQTAPQLSALHQMVQRLTQPIAKPASGKSSSRISKLSKS